MGRTRPVRFTRRWLLAAAAGTVATAAAATAVRAADAPPPLTEDRKIVHSLNRLGFGPRAGDVERVKRLGLPAYVRQQLHPDAIPDAATEKALEPLETLKMDTGHFVAQYYEEVKYFLELQMAYGNADDLKMRTGLDLKRDKQGGTMAAAGAGMTGSAGMYSSADAGGATRPAGSADKGKPSPIPNLLELSERHAIRCIAELQQAKLMRAALSERQLQEVMVDFWSNHFNVDVRKDAGRTFQVAYDRDVIRPRVLGRFRDLLGAVAHSPAMLAYLDNNQNSVARKRSKIEQTAIEWYVGYKFGMRVDGVIPDKEGLNENYGRELLELHTLGVDGGYTQQDVQAVARCFTGWNYSPFDGSFNFEKRRHDDGEKVVLGRTISAGKSGTAGGGESDGNQVLDLLARHPSTARFISRKLCQRFVADDPPAALVEKAAEVFESTDGDLRAVVEAIVTSDAFYAPSAARAKIKSPFEYAASAVRATGAEFTGRGWGPFGKLSYVGEAGALLGNDPKPSREKKKSLIRHVHDMGQPLFAHAAPQGYPEASAKWVSPGALIDRMNFAVALAQDRDVTDVKADARKLVGRDVDATDTGAVVDRLAEAILHQPLSAATRRTLLRTLGGEGGAGGTGEGGESGTTSQTAAKPVDVRKAAALIIGSPDFQRR
jgi:uncharacterized protein (DUF1800 family)